MKWTLKVNFALLNFLLVFVEETATRNLTTSGASQVKHGTTYLIQEFYFEQLLKDMEDERVYKKYSWSKAKTRLSPNILEYELLPYRPELQFRYEGSGPPPMSSVDPLYTNTVQKRSAFDMGLAIPACPFTIKWKLIFKAKDMNNMVVEVFQPTNDPSRYQWFYTVSCDYVTLMSENRECPFCCRGYENNRQLSRCIPQKSFVMAFIRRPGHTRHEWSYIQVDTSCMCAVSQS